MVTSVILQADAMGLMLRALLLSTVVASLNSSMEIRCPALLSDEKLRVSYAAGVGYGFHRTNLVQGPRVSRGLVILPEEGVAPEAYAPYAREVAKAGYYAAVVEKATSGRAIRAMMQQPLLQYWVLAGHGKGGAVAARLALTLHPKVKALLLLAAPVPKDVDLRSLNLLLVVLYGENDNVVKPATITRSFSRMPGDCQIILFPHLGHYDFVGSACVGNSQAISQNRRTVLSNEDFTAIASAFMFSLLLAHWPGATEKALSFGDNEKLTPGHNDSKIYPGDIRVEYSEIPIPDTSQQRLWWVFTPSQIKGGLVYYPGAAVDGRAYFHLAFEIAARGHLVVIVQQPLRYAVNSSDDANVVLDSKLPLFSGVPKNRWAVGGHSLGGAGAISYASRHGDRIYAAVLHAGGWAANLTGSDLPVVQIYGTLDDLAGGYDNYRSFWVDPPPNGIGPLVNLNSTKFVTIHSGNHYQVGDYGYQYPDQIATISLEQQHVQIAEETVSFLDKVV